MNSDSLIKKETPVAKVTQDNPKRVLRPAVDIFENDEGLTLVADLPGVAPGNLRVEMEAGTLNITGETGTEEAASYQWREFGPTSYQRSFRLPEDVDSNQIDARLEGGVLTVKLPKAATAKPRPITIKTVH